MEYNMSEEQIDITKINEFMLGTVEGNSHAMGRLRLAKGYCKKIKLPSVDFPICKVVSVPMETKGGFFCDETNEITIFVQADQEKLPADKCFYHEFGHWIDARAGTPSSKPDFPKIEDQEKEVSDYAANNDNAERFAETFWLYMADP
jgi:hypothetical protein